MNRNLLPLALAVLVLSAAGAATPAALAADAVGRMPLVPLGGSTDYAIVEVGSSAPDFAYETLGGGSARLRDLRAQGHVLIVFGADERALGTLERERDGLRRLGVVPVAVLDWRVSACRGVVRRLGLTYPVVPDAQRAIGAQYNVLDPNTRHDSPAWFVVERGGRVRDLARFAFPASSWTNVVASALGLPLDGASVPAGHPAR